MKKRVRIPTNNLAALFALVKRVQEKHIADGDASLLKPLDWPTLGPIVTRTIAYHETAERLKRDMKDAYEQRNLGTKAVTKLVRGSRDILTGVKIDEMKSLGQWGFDVLDQRTGNAEVIVDGQQA